MHAFAWVGVAVIFNAVAQLLMKAGMLKLQGLNMDDGVVKAGLAIASNGPVVAGIGCYMASLIAWLVVLSKLEISLAYPLVSVGYVLVAVAGWWLFNENLTAMRIAGIVVIMVGVVMVSKTA